MPKKDLVFNLPSPTGPLVVVYHSVDDLEKSGRGIFFSEEDRKKGGLLNIDPGTFARHLEFFERHFRIISSRALLQASFKRKMPKRALVITFDDGHRGVYENAIPLLKKKNIPATIFITQDYADGKRISNSAREFYFHNKPGLKRYKQLTDAEISKKYRFYMNWCEIGSLSKKLFTIGNHGRSHYKLSSIGRKEIVNEIDSPLPKIRKVSGMKKPFYAFPYGTKADYNKFSEKTAIKNHSALFTAYGGANPIKIDLKDIRRIPMCNIGVCNFWRSKV